MAATTTTTTTSNGIFLHNPLVYAANDAALVRLGEHAAAIPTGELLPASVRTWLARARLLEGVPFQHLVPDAQLLPPESIRFFHVNREWTDALVQGALAVGTVTSQDRRQLQVLHAAIRDEVDAEERRVRMVGSDDDPELAPAGPISGFLLRSRLVSGWPGLHVRAYKEDLFSDSSPMEDFEGVRMRLLRLERLAPAVLLCLFDGIPAVLHIEEPRAGVQYGVDLDVQQKPVVKLRNVLTAQRLEDLSPPTSVHTIGVPMRKGSPGVIDIRLLGVGMMTVPATKIQEFEGPALQSSEFGMEMLQFPFRQVFGADGESSLRSELAAATDAFRPTIGLDEVRSWEQEEGAP
jgi:hypothetical protein